MRLTMVLAAVSLLTISSCAFVKKEEKGINFDQVYEYALYSSYAYSEPAELRSWLESERTQLISTNKDDTDEVQYYLARPQNRGYDVIAIRGTSSLDDALVDMQFKLKPSTALNINLHEGFARGADIVFEHVKDKLDPRRPLHVTGHSLGGAVAVTLSMVLMQNGYTVDAVYTYGQPKVTDWSGREKYKQLPLTRVVTPRDIVPIVPPVSIDRTGDTGLYWHIGDDVLLLSGQEFAALDFFDTTKRQIVTLYPNLLGERELSAHYMDTYLELIKPKRAQALQVEYKP